MTNTPPKNKRQKSLKERVPNESKNQSQKKPPEAFKDTDQLWIPPRSVQAQDENAHYDIDGVSSDGEEIIVGSESLRSVDRKSS